MWAREVLPFSLLQFVKSTKPEGSGVVHFQCLFDWRASEHSRQRPPNRASASYLTSVCFCIEDIHVVACAAEFIPRKNKMLALKRALCTLWSPALVLSFNTSPSNSRDITVRLDSARGLLQFFFFVASIFPILPWNSVSGSWSRTHSCNHLTRAGTIPF